MRNLRMGTTVKTDKKRRERRLLAAFGSVYSPFPSGRLGGFERPDFVLCTDAGTVIGIELVDYVRGQALVLASASARKRLEGFD
ncbi:MAG: hypothetical protein ACOC7N_01105 [Chloroflexota bacterium]